MEKLVEFTGQIVITVDHEDDIPCTIREQLDPVLYEYTVISVKEY